MGLPPHASVKKAFLETKYGYDANGNVTTIETPEGYTIKREYDLLDRLTKETQTDPQSGIHRSTSYQYDKAGNRIVETDPLGRTTLRTYDYHNNLVTETDQEGGVTCYHYDHNQQVRKIILPDQYAKGRDQGAGVTFTYDSQGRLASVTNALGVLEEKNRYDRRGNLLEKQDALGRLVSYTYDIGGRRKTVATQGSQPVVVEGLFSTCFPRLDFYQKPSRLVS